MRKLACFAFWTACLVAVTLPILAADTGRERPRLDETIYAPQLVGEAIAHGAAKADTVYLIGGPGQISGKFQSAPGWPDRQGWIGIDFGEQEVHWHIDSYNCANLDPLTAPNHAWWCGEDYPACDGGDPVGGYGNFYLDYLDWYGEVAAAAESVTVRLTAELNYDNEPGYDYLYLQYEGVDVFQTVATYNGIGTGVAVDVSFAVAPENYVPHPDSGLPSVHLRWHFASDGAWSDEDCLHATAGAAQIDLVQVTFDQGAGEIPIGPVETCEDNDEDGQYEDDAVWRMGRAPSPGDFSRVWPRLTEIDRCRENTSPMFAFIDDGTVVPGTGGYLCTTWCYGPGGYIVNPEGGLAGPDEYLNNEIWSPILAWPESDYEGAVLEFDIYSHMPFTYPGSPGMMWQWRVRSTNDPTGESGWTGWRDRSSWNQGLGENWVRIRQSVPDLLLPDRTFVQIALQVIEIGWIWGFEGTDGTPAPYYDNVAFKAIQHDGPEVSGRDIEQAQDAFPACGTIDPVNLGRNHVRFDMAMNIAPPSEMRNRPGDSLTFTIAAIRAGSVLNERPRLFYKLAPNPLFDPHRTSGQPLQGWVEGDTIRTLAGYVVQDRWSFDLPDSGFFFPGDVIHYYVRAEDDLGGDIGVTRLPGDTTGFSLFAGHPDYETLQYPRAFTVRALPSLHPADPDSQPRVLYVADGDRAPGYYAPESDPAVASDYWRQAFAQLGFREGLDYDLYLVKSPTSGVGNGIGGRATGGQLAGYSTICYGCGDVSSITLSNGDPYDDPGDDIGVLDAWLRSGQKNLFLTGDDLAYDLYESGASSAAFLADWLGIDYVQHEVKPLVGDQCGPQVAAIAGNPVFTSLTQWWAGGCCPYFHTFDAVTAASGALRLAEFTDPDGQIDAYDHAAATLHVVGAYGARVISLPVGFPALQTAASGTPGKELPAGIASGRAAILHNVLAYFGHLAPAQPVGLPERTVFAARGYPNPFNPRLTIAYEMPRAGRLTIRIYNLRGEWIRTLIDGEVEAGPGRVEWNGRDAQGRQAASGIYFYEASACGRTVIERLAFIK
jgi:hypothetical protein